MAGSATEKRRSELRRALDADAAAMAADDPVDDRQAEAAAGELGRVEGLEHPGLHLRRHAAAAVG